MELSVEAHVALMHHFRVNALPDPLADMDDPDVAIAHAEMALEVALRTGVVDLMHASQLMLQMHLVLSVTKDIETLTVLKELAASAIKAVGNQEAQAASDAQVLADAVDVKLAEIQTR